MRRFAGWIEARPTHKPQTDRVVACESGVPLSISPAERPAASAWPLCASVPPVKPFLRHLRQAYRLPFLNEGNTSFRRHG
jgi:hypothetical protein